METQDSTINETNSQPEQNLSVADAMRQTMADMKEREAKEEKKAQKAEQVKKEVKQEPKTEVKPEEKVEVKQKEVKTEEKTEEKAEQPKEAKKEAKPEEEGKAEDSEKTEESEEPKTEKKAIRAPSSWSAKAKDSFFDLPDHIKTEVLKREEDFHNGIKQYKEKSDYAEKLQRVIMPYEAHLRASNQNPEQVVQTMLDAAYRLGQGTPQQKAQYLLQIAKESGADLQSLVNSGNNAESTGNNHSNEQNAYVAQLEQRLRQLEGHTAQQATLSQQQEEQQIFGTIEQFKNEVDESGRPKHPFFENVESDMAALITIAKQQGRQAPTLSQAYEQAVWANPQTREALLLRQQKEAQAKREAEANRKAEEAAKKTHFNVPRTNVEFSQSAPTGDIRQTMRAALNDMKARS